MKNFNIEDLPQKNIYKTPDFFGEMQENVLQKTVFSIAPVRERRVKKNKNWLYGAVASVVLLTGMTVFFTDSNAGKTEKTPKILMAKNNAKTIQNIEIFHEEMPANSDFSLKKTEEIEAPKMPAVKPVSVPEVKGRLIVDPPYISQKDIAKNNIDEIVRILPENDLAELSNDADADMYLDLYN